MNGLEGAAANILLSLLTELLIVVLGYIIGATAVRKYKEYRYGKWHAYLLNGDDRQILDRPLSAATAERVLADEAELNVYLKGLISPFGRVHCDLVTQLEAPNPALIHLDHTKRTITVRMIEPYITPEAGVVQSANLAVDHNVD